MSPTAQTEAADQGSAQSQPVAASKRAVGDAAPSAAFTPGPWWVDDRRGWSGALQIQAKHRGEGSNYCVASVNFYEVPEANARLIAAAPDLLNGCNALLGLCTLLLTRDDLPAAVRTALTESHRVDEAKAAIAKASA